MKAYRHTARLRPLPARAAWDRRSSRSAEPEWPYHAPPETSRRDRLFHIAHLLTIETRVDGPEDIAGQRRVELDHTRKLVEVNVWILGQADDLDRDRGQARGGVLVIEALDQVVPDSWCYLAKSEDSVERPWSAEVGR